MKKRVLILCTGNSARSHIAEGLLRHDAGDAFEVESAGTKPGTVRPEAIKAMQEVGIDSAAIAQSMWMNSTGSASITSLPSATTRRKPVRCSRAMSSNCITASTIHRLPRSARRRSA
jgi:hypothetical protein